MSNSAWRIFAIVVLVLALITAGSFWAAQAFNRPGSGSDNAFFLEASPTPTAPTSALPLPSSTVPAAATQAVEATATQAEVAQATVAPGAPGELPVDKDVTYCTAGDVPLMMDVYHPRAEAAGPVPAVLYVHGGGWTSGDKSGARLWAGLLAQQGYLVASINYRLAPQYKWPAQIEDSKCAVRYLRASAAKYNIDPNRIGAIGDSAGGHLVSLLGLTGPEAGFEGNGGYAEQSSAVQAVIDMYGPTDFTSVDLRAESVRIAQLLGIPLAQAPAVLRNASPVTYAKKDAPPFFIIQGDQDQLVAPSQSQLLYQRLKDAGADANLLIVKNAGHGFVPSGGQIQPSLLVIGQRIGAFFARTLKGQGSGG